MPDARQFLDGLFRTAVVAAHPSSCLPRHLPPPPRTGRLIVLAAGKAAGSMAEVTEAAYADLPPGRLTGIAVARQGYARPLRLIPMIEAGHPIPDAAGLEATDRALALADSAGPDDLVLVLLSGGASANWIAPVEGLSLGDKQGVTRALLRSGANIGEINTVRKHLSRIKGGRLARRAHRARVLTLAISDVPGDDPAVIGSGPTVADPTTLADARAIVARFRLDLPETVARALADPKNESPKPNDPVFSSTEFKLIARPADAFRAAEQAVREAGYECVMLGDRIEGEARDVAADQAGRALALQRQGRRAVLLSGGELTVTIRGQGRGGPNQEYALALAMALDGAPGIAALAGDTDGTDGGAGSADDPAGAWIDQNTLARARRHGLDPAHFLSDNNSTGFFTRLGDLIETGPTWTNVNDFRAIVVDRP
ncbi:MAG: glycerate 2-kinase [Alphaproteobacteria bacterium]|jgi:hydroxypyruvate reductase|nr:glycerate 2-kinase [Alphaproteobacteria bacterium]